jgi:hypothetical protein
VPFAEGAHTGARLDGPQMLLPCSHTRFASAGVLQVKMRELGLTTHQDYKLTCMLDHKAMITVQTEKYGACLAHAMLAVARVLLAHSSE